MKFTCQVEINLPIEKVIPLYQNVDNLKHWQDGFISYKHVSGNPGKKNAKSKFEYQIGKRKIELIETIIINDLPHQFSGLYETKEMTNTMTNSFEEADTNKTLYTTHIEYTQFNGLMPKLMAKLFPGMFRKQTQKWLNQFKEFVEEQS
jgi:uncharacterized membrane protein